MATAFLKKLCVLSALSMTSVSFAQEEGGKEPGENLVARKEMILKNIDETISDLQASKACVQSATSHDALKACKKEARHESLDRRGDRKSDRSEFKKDKLEDREKRRAEREARRKERGGRRGGAESSAAPTE